MTRSQTLPANDKITNPYLLINDKRTNPYLLINDKITNPYLLINDNMTNPYLLMTRSPGLCFFYFMLQTFSANTTIVLKGTYYMSVISRYKPF